MTLKEKIQKIIIQDWTTLESRTDALLKVLDADRLAHENELLAAIPEPKLTKFHDPIMLDEILCAELKGEYMGRYQGQKAYRLAALRASENYRNNKTNKELFFL